MRRQARGFTLIEMLIVFAVFAVIGVISSQIVSRVIDNHRTMRERGDRLQEVQRAMQIMQRDIVQLIHRPVRDQLGDPLEPVLIGADGLIEFTRLGWRNPLGLRRAQVQRVAYATQDTDLYRVYWNVLDRTPDTVPVRQSLLSKVEQIEFVAVDVTGNEHSFWPPASAVANAVPTGVPGAVPVVPTSPDNQLAAIIVRLDIEPFGTVERLWPVPPPQTMSPVPGP